jgi:hypothetical protein
MAHRSTHERATIAVCGSGSGLDPEIEELAEAVGEEVVRAGMNLVTGGLGGVMEAASRGAAQAREKGEGDGAIIGILPGDDRRAANPYCDLVIPTGLGIARNLLVVRTAQAVILVHGGSGTLAEAAFAWQIGKPVLALSSSGGWAGRLGGQRLDGRRSDSILTARTAAEAVALVRDELTGIR